MGSVKYILRPLLFVVSAIVMAWSATLIYPLGPLSSDQPVDPLVEVASLLAVDGVERELMVQFPGSEQSQVASGASDEESEPDGVSITFTLTLDADTEAARRILAGALTADPASAAWLGVGKVALAADMGLDEIDDTQLFEYGEDYPLQWDTAEVKSDGTTLTTTLRAESTGQLPDLVSVLAALPHACLDEVAGQYVSGCPLQVTLDTGGREVAATYPPGVVTSRDVAVVVATIDGAQDASEADDTQETLGVLRVDVATEDDLASTLAAASRTWVTNLWRYAWQVLPWLLLFGFLLKVRPTTAGQEVDDFDRSRGAYTRLLWASLVSALLVALNGVEREVVMGSVLAAGPALLLVWAWHSHRWVWPGASKVRAFSIGVLALLGVLTVIVLVSDITDASDLAGGAILSLVGSAGAVLALEPRWSSLPAAGAAAGTVVLLATTQDAGGAVDSWLGGAVALFGSLAFLVLLTWVAAVGTRSPVVDRARGIWWVRLLTVVLALAMLWPDARPRLASSPIQLQDFVSDFAVASPALIWLGLILATVGLLWVVASNPLPGPTLRSLAILVALALMLRSNVVVGLPWSFLVGAVLVWRVLYVSAGETSTRTLWPSAREGSAETISSLVRASASSQFARNMRASARRRATSGGVSFEEAAAFRRAYETPETPLPEAPSERERSEAMGWGAVADPRDRALRSMGAALLIGIPLSIPYLAQVGTQLSVADLTSVTTWGEIVTAFIFVLRFPLYGLVFGYFFPLVRGTTGLGKSLHLLIVLVISEGITLLVPFGSTESFLEAFSLRALGLAALCLVLGIGADAWALRRAGSGVADLADLYQVRRATLSISTVTVAVLTTAATTMATVGVTSATERLFQQVESPPAATATQSSDEGRDGAAP